MYKIKQKSTLAAAVAISMGVVSTPASAVILDMSWSGLFTMLNTTGVILSNSSIVAKGANSFQTPISGTLSFDTVSGAGVATMDSFYFGSASAPATFTDINMQFIGDGAGGAGPLLLSNMFFNWSGTASIPASVVLDGSGLFNQIAMGTLAIPGQISNQGSVAGSGAVPASDGTYTDSTWGYLAIGPVPIATTEWNLTAAADCGNANNSTNLLTGGGCMGNGAAGRLDLVPDVVTNPNEYLQGDGVGIGGVPMWDGPFGGFNANLDFLALELTGVSSGYINPAPFMDIPPPECYPLDDPYYNYDPYVDCSLFTQYPMSFQTYIAGLTAVPIPASIWLFGSGLLGGLAVVRRKKV